MFWGVNPFWGPVFFSNFHQLSHRNWRSSKAAPAFEACAKEFLKYPELGWLGINCVGGCGSNIKPVTLPQIHFYEKPKKKGDALVPIVCRLDLTDPEEISKFVIRNLFPFKIIPRKSSENTDVDRKKKILYPLIL